MEIAEHPSHLIERDLVTHQYSTNCKSKKIYYLFCCLIYNLFLLYFVTIPKGSFVSDLVYSLLNIPLQNKDLDPYQSVLLYLQYI